jgi:pullulanase-type alpha-1,6-glucosidase
MAAALLLLPACVEESLGPETTQLTGDIVQAKAYWLAADTIAWNVPEGSSVRLHFSPNATLELTPEGLVGGESIALSREGVIGGALAEKFPHLAGLPAFRISNDHVDQVPGILKSQFAVSAIDTEGRPLDATALQPAGVLDDLFTFNGALGIGFEGKSPRFRLWAPTARSVKLHLFDGPGPGGEPTDIIPMDSDPETGTWSTIGDESWNRKYYLYEVKVYVRTTGRIEQNLVTDPYSLSLAMDSKRSQIVKLSDPDLKPEGWDSLDKPFIDAPEDIVLYELHVRDFSISDPTVPEGQRGTFAAFNKDDTLGMRHLRGLSEAGLTHVHLLPVFDCATIPEDPADQLAPPDLSGFESDSETQQAEIDNVRAKDAFNWCYDPYHYTVPEGSYSTDPDGTARIRELREMVAALNRIGLRVVMDVVYNHTSTSGQAEKSVLDRIVPDYYQRLDGAGKVETSTCCANTATENAMMEKLMVDSLLTWAAAYKVDAFRFDLMGHHSRTNIEKVRDALHALTLEKDGIDGTSIYLYGEGWNFGEVADDSRFVQATQPNMGDGTGVGTFNDRIRDAVRGGAHDDEGILHLQTQGFVNGLFLAPNAEGSGGEKEKAKLLHFADLIRVSLAGNLADYRLVNRHGVEVLASDIDYEGQPAAYSSDPQETVNYIAAHDNETLFDINQYKLPVETSMDDRVRVVNLANSIVMLAQGVPFFHAGQDMLRSKSLDSNSFDSGDWFNLLDFSYETNGWARGLPPAWDNEANWLVGAPLLGNPGFSPRRNDILAANAHMKEMLRIRKSSERFRLRTAGDVMEQLTFHNTGPDQVPGLIVMQLEDDTNETIVVLFNATTQAQSFTLDRALGFHLHPVQQNSGDPVVRAARFEDRTKRFNVPARTTAVFIAIPLNGN